jgi:copper(I)-binding protein
MRTPVLILINFLMIFALGACGSNEAPAPAATVRLAAAPGRPAAGYLTLQITGDRGALVSVASPQAGRIEMHETMSEGTMSAMRAIERIPVRDGETLAFEPGGRHLMLFDVDPAVHAGGRIDLVLNFEHGAPVTLAAEAAAPGEQVSH